MTAAVFTLPLPPTTNKLFANVPGKGRTRTAAYRQWQTEAGWTIQADRRGQECIPNAPSYTVEIQIHPAYRGDIDNLAKPILDILVKQNVTPDDKHCRSLLIERSGPEKGNAIVRIFYAPLASQEAA